MTKKNGVASSHPFHSSFAAAEAAALLTIDLAALRSNYAALANRAAPAECGAVVKADAYGLGLEPVATTLHKAGCQTFFVATLAEARELRATVPGATVYVLDGLLPETESLFAAEGLRPVLNSLPEIADWSAYCAGQGKTLKAALHIDSGMNRLGLSGDDIGILARDPALLSSFDISLVMSHLACADAPDHPKNRQQLKLFETLRKLLPKATASLANSAGIFHGPDYLFDLVRPGIALYGGEAVLDRPNPMNPVIRLEGRIAQIREAQAGETVGYGAGHHLSRDTRIATVPVGYADGFIRLLGASDEHPGLTAYIGDHPAPLLGRVSMDLITIDVTDIPSEHTLRGTFVELIGPHVTIDDIATRAQTIGYEVPTSLGRRYHRVYKGA
ncbi:alanine racemase, biosynthetic [bacterium MnTg02]|nr:alanine racemase, biosynthetic [bacterium MnTg02]